MKCNANNCNTTAHKGGDFVPRLAMINDIAGFGRCSTTVSLPVISVMKVQVCPVPTSVLSNHLGFPLCHFDDYTSHMRDYIKVWNELGLTFDGLYCGFLGNEEQINIVREFVEMFRPPLFLLDPVMGDHGRAYSSITETHVQKMKDLLPLADIITPNITEACLLTGTPWKDGEWTMQELSGLCERLADICQQESVTSGEASTGTTANGASIVITGIRQGDSLVNFLWDDGVYTTVSTPIAGASRPGTGDIFASILAADAVRGETLLSSVQKAANFVGLCIAGSEKAGTPVQEGVVFEKYLAALL
ncbi:MAG: pyridoxamine kinase [Lachnospiraceae bacterium]|uniref:Pyridoxamine kinase n=1 Tax=Waltera intestinalis TaxID=2606635 RepID=A0A6L5YLI0_9FIRM|nr:pyridoxamine kinase [Waltera intestinalis]MDY3657146.1 pyridoxamine kinase [Lachnospiraceae bacterium]MST58497.1 pyridoxamine kinase [Waltera intestinalis]